MLGIGKPVLDSALSIKPKIGNAMYFYTSSVETTQCTFDREDGPLIATIGKHCVNKQRLGTYPTHKHTPAFTQTHP